MWSIILAFPEGSKGQMVKIIACQVSVSKTSAPPSPAKFSVSPLGGYPPPSLNAVWKTLGNQKSPPY